MIIKSDHTVTVHTYFNFSRVKHLRYFCDFCINGAVHPHNATPEYFRFYQTFRSDLKHVLEDRKQKNPGLGSRYLAKRAGFASPSTLSMMISGKRKFTDATAEKLAKALCITGRKPPVLKATHQVRIGPHR